MGQAYLNSTLTYTDPAEGGLFLRAGAEAAEWASADNVHKYLDATGAWTTPELGPSADSLTALSGWPAIIAESKRAAKSPDKWASWIGQEAEFTYDSETYHARLIDIAHFERSDGGGTCGFVFEFVELIHAQMNLTATNTGGWPSMKLCKEDMPGILTKLPADIQGGIVEVKLKYNTYRGSGSGDSAFNISDTTGKLFVASSREIDGTKYTFGNDGEQLAWYKTHTANTDRQRKVHSSAVINDSIYGSWWTRSCDANTTNFRAFATTGENGSSSANARSESENAGPNVCATPIFCLG